MNTTEGATYKPKVTITKIATGEESRFDDLPEQTETLYDLNVRQAAIVRLFR
jgi:hypothetical protein